MLGKILQVNISAGGLPKRPISLGRVGLTGLDGDHFNHPRFHGGLDQALLMIASETINMLKELGYPVYPGALGENLTTVGLEPRDWRIGQQFRAGSARFELTKLRTPCRMLDRFGSGYSGVPIQKLIFGPLARRGDVSAPNWGMSGIYARITQPGEIAAGDSVILESELA